MGKRDKLIGLRPPLPGDEAVLRKGKGDRVILLHGLWRSHLAMKALSDGLGQKDYEVLSFPYPSFLRTLEDIVQMLAETLRELPEKRTHFVSHSMGGIVVRALAKAHSELVCGRVVMIAPPSQGSELVDWLEDSPLGQLILGPGGLALGKEKVRREVPPGIEGAEVGVIMGRGGRNPLFQSFLEGENDGTVTVEGGKVEGMADFAVVDYGHMHIQQEEEVVKMVEHFLSKGQFQG